MLMEIEGMFPEWHFFEVKMTLGLFIVLNIKSTVISMITVYSYFL